MDFITAIEIFVIPVVIVIVILILFGTMQRKSIAAKKEPLFRPIGPENNPQSSYNPYSYNPYTQPGTTMPAQVLMQTPAFKGKKEPVTPVGICFVTGELTASCRCPECEMKRKGS